MTQLRKILAVLVLCSASVLTPVAQLQAQTIVVFDGDSYAAIAYSPSTGKYGYAYNYGSRWAAEAAALAYCEAPDAEIVVWVNNGFCALALGDEPGVYGVGWSYGDGSSNVAAMNWALYECGKRTTNPRIVVVISSQG